MPHITLECSGNVEMDFRAFFKELGEEYVATGHVPKLGFKCRVVLSESYYIIDGNPDFKMVNLLLRLREGRSQEVLQQFSTIASNLLHKYLHEAVVAKEVIISTEIKELIKGQDLTKNTIRERK